MSSLQTQVQFAIRSTQLPRPDANVTRPFVEHFAAQNENPDIATLASRSLQRPALAPKLEDRVVDFARVGDCVAHRAALVAAATLVASPGLAAGLYAAGSTAHALGENDAVRVGAGHRFLEALAKLGDPAAATALQMASLPAAAAAADSVFTSGGPSHLTDRQYLAKVGSLAIDTVFSHDRAGSGQKVELASTFMQALAPDPSAKVVGELMQSVNHERVKTLLGRATLEAMRYARPDASTEHVLALAGLELFGDCGVRASNCDDFDQRSTYSTDVPKGDLGKQVQAATTIARWLAAHGSEEVRDLAAMTAGIHSDFPELLVLPCRTLFESVLNATDRREKAPTE